MMKKTRFNKKDKNWDTCTFYQIYMKDNVKMIKLIGQTDRVSKGYGYLAWVCTYYYKDCEMPLEKALEWDILYQLNHLIKKYDNYNTEWEVEPNECFEHANKWLGADGNGSVEKCIIYVNENTPCGYYYG